MWENVTLTASDIGALAPGDDISELNNDSGFITAADVGDGTITITKADGTEVGSFTVNQAGDTSIALPADVVPSPPGDGKLTIEDADGNSLGEFTANQATGNDVVITLPAQQSVYWDRSGTTLTPSNAGDAISVAKVTTAVFDLESLSPLP